MLMTVDAKYHLVLNGAMTKVSRAYTLRSRAEGVERTRAMILGALIELTAEMPFVSISLTVIAKRAGVTVQTVLRHFGTREGVIDAALDFAIAHEEAVRRCEAGDVDGALGILIERYESQGDAVLTLLGQERWEPRVLPLMNRGRAFHAAWLETVFSPQLAGLSASERSNRIDLLVVATDLYTWKLLRRDRGRSKTRTLAQMRLLTTYALKGSS